MSDMDWTRERPDDPVVVRAPNVLIASNRLELKNRVQHELDQGGRRFLVDFSDTQYIDSSGLGVLVMLTKTVGKFGGELHLANLNDDLRSLLALSKLDTILSILEGEGDDSA